jgi:hypothetical protein
MSHTQDPAGGATVHASSEKDCIQRDNLRRRLWSVIGLTSAAQLHRSPRAGAQLSRSSADGGAAPLQHSQITSAALQVTVLTVDFLLHDRCCNEQHARRCVTMVSGVYSSGMGSRSACSRGSHRCIQQALRHTARSAHAARYRGRCRAFGSRAWCADHGDGSTTA